MREIVFDTETTGLDPLLGHRLVEIGCIELVNRFPTGRVFHRYFNPERDMPAEAFAVHGLSIDFLRGHGLFGACVDELLDFLGDAQLIAHNAFFDLGFINAELEKCAKRAIGRERLIDTLMLARRKHPGSSNKLDDLCVRYRIDNSRRTKNGALLDAELLAEVYVELIGARQAMLGLAAAREIRVENRDRIATAWKRPEPLPARLSAQEEAAHAAFVTALGEKALWREYSGE
ncbi:MAG: DNA polymerase III subunit epsilon [Pseudorhodoplanes sp.]